MNLRFRYRKGEPAARLIAESQVRGINITCLHNVNIKEDLRNSASHAKNLGYATEYHGSECRNPEAFCIGRLLWCVTMLRKGRETF